MVIIPPGGGFVPGPRPTVDTITPASGATIGRAPVVITGTRLGRTTAVMFGAIAGTSLVVIDDETLSVSAPVRRAA